MIRLALMSLPMLGALALVGTAVSNPAPSRQIADGHRLYMENCAACHGEDGQRGAAYQTPIWGARSRITKFETVLGLFEYNQITMPFDNPERVTDEEKLAIMAFILANHGAMPASATLEYGSAASIRSAEPGGVEVAACRRVRARSPVPLTLASLIGGASRIGGWDPLGASRLY